MSTVLDVTPAVAWRPEAGSDADWRELLPVPGDNPGFSEARRFLFRKPGRGWSFRVDDEPLAAAAASGCWLWEPGFYAGEVTAELLDEAGRQRALYLLGVAPDASKLGRDVFQTMLNELWAVDPRLVIGSEPATTSTGELGDIEDPWLAFARLRRHAPDFLRAIDAVRAAPRRALRFTRESAALHQVRRADRQTLASVLRSTAVAVVFANPEDDIRVPATSRVDVPRTEETLDSAANRAMLALTLGVLRRALDVAVRLGEAVAKERDSETRTSLADRWPARREFLEGLGVALRRVVRRPPFSELRRAEISAAGLNAVSADPVYSRAWGRGWRALRHGVETGSPSERLWVSPSWEVYERWCFLRLGQMLAGTYPEMGWQLQVAERRWTTSAPNVRSSLELQATFPSAPEGRPGRWSVSRQREPDLLLSVDDEHGTRFMLLDAKYRVSRANVLEAMESAHIYQDSLRIGNSRPDAALLLVPAAGGAPALESETFHERHRVGVHPLTAGSNDGPPVLVRRFLEKE